MASKGAAGHVLTFLGAVILLPILRALGLRTAADSLAALLGHAPKRGLKGHQAALEEFYSAQAASYDATRGVLLKGREEMLERAMALILEKRESGERLTTWLDIGGGTGYNIEAANAILGKLKPGLALKDVFEKVYLVDLSPSLLGVARKRFEALKMQVEVVEADAGTYRPENWTEGRAGLVTFSYSLSMIPSPFAAAENAISLLKPDGYLGVVDFYTSPYKSAPEHPSLEDGIRRTSWGLSSFWTSWFAFDGIHLSPDRRMYLEHITSPIFSRSYRNLWFGLPFVRIPYYIHLGQPRIQSTGSVESPIAVLEEKRGRTSPPADVDTSSARHKKKRAGSASSVKSTDSSKSLERVAGGI